MGVCDVCVMYGVYVHVCVCNVVCVYVRGVCAGVYV